MKGCEVIIVVFTIIFIKRIVNVQHFSYGRIARSHYNHLTELIRYHQPAMRSDARTLPTTTRVIIIVITMATVITIVIASQTLTSPPLPHPVPFGGQFGISQPLYPALAHFITRSCQIQSSSLCFDYHRNVAHCHHCHHCHQYYTIVVTDSPHSSSCSFTIVQLYFETVTFISGCQSQMTGRHFQSRCERSHPTLSFASDPTIPSNIEKNPSTTSR